MAEKTSPPAHPAFAGERPEAIDHKNPPKPQPAGDPAKQTHPAFACARPDAIDHKNPPKRPGGLPPAAPAAAPGGTPPASAKLSAFAWLLFLILALTQSAALATSTSVTLTNNTGAALSVGLYSATTPLVISGLQIIPVSSNAVVSGTGSSWLGVVLVNTNNNLAVVANFNVWTNGYLASALAAGTVVFYSPYSSVAPDNITNSGPFQTYTNTLAGDQVQVPGELKVFGAGIVGVNGVYTNFYPPVYTSATNLATGFYLTESITTNSISGIGNAHQQYCTFWLSKQGTNYYTNVVSQTKFDSFVTAHGWPVQSPNPGYWTALVTNYNPAPTSSPVYFYH